MPSTFKRSALALNTSNKLGHWSCRSCLNPQWSQFNSDNTTSNVPETFCTDCIPHGTAVPSSRLLQPLTYQTSQVNWCGFYQVLYHFHLRNVVQQQTAVNIPIHSYWLHLTTRIPFTSQALRRLYSKDKLCRENFACQSIQHKITRFLELQHKVLHPVSPHFRSSHDLPTTIFASHCSCKGFSQQNPNNFYYPFVGAWCTLRMSWRLK